MNHREFFIKYVKFEQLTGRGGYWLDVIQKFIPVTQIASQVAIWKIIFWSWGVPTWVIITAVAVKYYLEKYILPYFIAIWEKKIGYWSLFNHLYQTNKDISPFNNQLQEQLREHSRVINEICKFLNINIRVDDKFKNIE